MALLSSRPNWSICGQASTGREAIVLASEHRPNIVVMDIAMPGLNGSLSAREREIVQLLAEGKRSKEVASVLGSSTKTAETHRANIMRKLEMHSVSELVRYAVKNCMLEP